MVPRRDLLDHSPRPRRLRGLRGFCWRGKGVLGRFWLIVGRNSLAARILISQRFGLGYTFPDLPRWGCGWPCENRDIVHKNFRLSEYVSDMRSEVKMFPAVLVLQANGGSRRFGCSLTPRGCATLRRAGTPVAPCCRSMLKIGGFLKTLTVVLLCVVCNLVPAFGAEGYQITKRIPVPGQGSWDYLIVDEGARRLYVSHGTQVEVLDVDSGALVGKIETMLGLQ